jgi:hypothetical protein
MRGKIFAQTLSSLLYSDFISIIFNILLLCILSFITIVSFCDVLTSVLNAFFVNKLNYLDDFSPCHERLSRFRGLAHTFVAWHVLWLVVRKIIVSNTQIQT